MFKLIVLSIIFLIFSYFGYIYGEKFNNRYKILQEILKAINILQNEIMYNSTALPEALNVVSEICRDPLSLLVKDVSRLIYKAEENSIFDMFKISYEKYKEDLCLKKEDIRIISDFLKSLGELGLYGQEKMFELAKANLNINIKDAQIIAEKNIKLYRYLGVCVGAMIFIFFI